MKESRFQLVRNLQRNLLFNVNSKNSRSFGDRKIKIRPKSQIQINGPEKGQIGIIERKKNGMKLSAALLLSGLIQIINNAFKVTRITNFAS